MHSNNRKCSYMHFCYICLQVSDDSAMENLLPCKRLADGSKRVRVPHFLSAQVKLKKHVLTTASVWIWENWNEISFRNEKEYR
jgi:hypothetical protein